MKEQIEEVLESDKIAPVLAGIMDFMGDGLLEEDRREPAPAPAPERDRHYARLIARDPHVRNPRYRRMRKGMLAAAILLAALAAVHASAFKAVLKNYFISRRPESMDFSESVNPDNHTWYAPVSLPSFIPEGYQYEKSTMKENIVSFLYTKPGQPDIRYFIYSDPTAVRLNSEGADDITELPISGKQGFRIIRKGEMQLFWGKDPALLIEGPSSLREDLLRMAESVVIPPRNGLE